LDSRLKRLLSAMASWPITRRIGLYHTSRPDQLNHRPQTLEREERLLEEQRASSPERYGATTLPLCSNDVALIQWS
jgi:hypothetical protein